MKTILATLLIAPIVIVTAVGIVGATIEDVRVEGPQNLIAELVFLGLFCLAFVGLTLLV